ncbi:MAG: GGDEF domain-containing protein [Labilithrix sp.]|nr:GGDEF domain-containing protein [Labilithrix sp.]
MKDPFKTRKMQTVPIPVPHAPEPAPSTPVSSGSSGGTRASIPIGPPSSESNWITGEMAADRATDPVLTVVPSADGKDRATLTLMTGINAGQVFAVDGTEHVIGRGTEADLWIEDGGVSRRHARIACRSDGRYFVEDLGSTNGTFLGSQRIETCEIRGGDRIQLGPQVILRFAITDDAEEELQRRLYESSTRDALTRIYNRKYFTERLTAEVAYSRRHKVKLAVLLLDVDDFKQINDTYGHLAGDMVLRLVSAQMQRLIRVEDLLARYGGEEFVILARSTGKTDAIRLAERIRESISELEITVDDRSLRVTMSIGLASLPDVAPEGGSTELIALADTRLYKAKGDGKNRVCSEGE